MKTHTILYVTAIIALLIVAGCGKKRDSVHLATMETLDKQLELTLQQIKAIDPALVKEADEFVLNSVTNLKDSGQNVDIETVANLASIRRPTQRFFRTYDHNINTINQTQKELKDRGKQFRKGKITEEELGSFVSEKKFMIDNFCTGISNDLESLREKMALYDSMKPTIEALLK